ncbi:MAG: hypothetical protein RBT63_01820, partial [Bdellovibrionales bacterium]|nr:hypothetical protein [Bdellovibrionales bacterium]
MFSSLKITALFSKITLSLIAFQIGFGIPLLSYPTTAQASQSQVPQADRENFDLLRTQVSREMIKAMETGFGGRDPALRDLMSVDMRTVQENIPNFAGAPVDADPFFMRSQTWRKSTSTNQEYVVVSDERSTEIQIPGTAKKLVLDIPLRGLIATDDYLFFSLHPESDLFDRLSGVSQSEGEGLFVIETTLLEYHAQRETPVPVFFLPIMGNGWRSDLLAMQIIQGDILAVSNGTEVIPFLMKDIREMIQISKINLDTSMMISLTKLQADGKVSSDPLMPAPGSTALLGLIVTGLDNTRPGYNFFRDFKSVAQNLNDLEEKGVGGRLIAAFKRSPLFKLLQIPKANAQADGEDPVIAAVKRSAFFGSIVAVTIVTAFVLKYKSKGVRQRLDQIHKYRRALDPEKVDAEKMRGFREFMRIEGSILASIAQFPLITPGIAVQYFVDRHMPSLGSGDHTLMRKVLNQTIYPNLRHFGKISVNEKVTMLGTGYAATAGIGMGALHYFYVLPMFIQSVTPSLPDGLAYALNETFNPQNRQTQATLFTNLLVSASIGILRGPADFTMDAKSQVIEELYSRVDNDLRRQGINPDDPKIQTRREHMREALVNLTLVQKGLPTSAEILFDTMSLYSSVSHKRGYASPTNDILLENINPLASQDIPFEKDENGRLRMGEDGKPVVQEGGFILSSRRGLLPNVLARALETAKAWHQLNPSTDTEQALRLVERQIENSERLRKILPKMAQAYLGYIENPSSMFGSNGERNEKFLRFQKEMSEINKLALTFRQMLVMSNYEGPIEYTVRYLPKSWVQTHGAPAANMSVLYVRQALASYLDGATTENIVAKREDLLSTRHKTQAEAIEAMRSQRPELSKTTDAEFMSDASLRAEVLQRMNILAKQYGDDQRADEN